MKNVTRILSEEHQHILKVIDVVLEECEQLEKGKEINARFFQNVISFIKNYADGFHHAKEENVLFKTMLEDTGNMHCNPIPVMLHEHDEGRAYVKGMEEALQSDDVIKLTENASGYCYLLQEHIFKEDNILYPMAEEGLSDEQKQRVEELYQNVNTGDFFDSDINAFIENLSQNRNE
jgi:hemerythrin-like domain-containing protein